MHRRGVARCLTAGAVKAARSRPGGHARRTPSRPRTHAGRRCGRGKGGHATLPRAGSTNPVRRGGGRVRRLRPPARPPTRPRGHRDLRTTKPCGQWQVFGLVGRASWRTRTYWPSLPGRAHPVRRTAVVPTHRCGAVPDLHRIPSCDAPAWRAGRTDCEAQHTGRFLRLHRGRQGWCGARHVRWVVTGPPPRICTPHWQASGPPPGCQLRYLSGEFVSCNIPPLRGLPSRAGSPRYDAPERRSRVPLFDRCE